MYCVSCGAAVLPENKFCVSCGGAAVMPAPIPQAAPGLSFGGYAGVPGGFVGIGFWPRVGARIIDLVVHYVIYIVGAFIFGIILGLVAAASHTPLEPMIQKMGELTASGFLLSLLGSAFYQTVVEGGAGTSLGKLAIGAVVLKEDGTRCGYKAAFIRSLAYFVDGLFFGAIGYMQMQKSPLQQRNGDAWAHTMVVAKQQAPPALVASGGQFFVVFMLACMADLASAILSFALKLI